LIDPSEWIFFDKAGRTGSIDTDILRDICRLLRRIAITANHKAVAASTDERARKLEAS
jgi:hypothetical protein